MQRLPTCQGLAGNDQGATVLPQLHSLWGTVNPDAGHVAYSGFGMFHAPAQSAGRLADIRALGGRDSHAGGRTTCDWPGKVCGVRAPFEDETPLSWAEVHHALAKEIL